MNNYGEEAVINFANKFTTVSFNPSTISEPAVDIVNMVNIHHHTKGCYKYNSHCRFSFPKSPVWPTLISCPKSGSEMLKNTTNPKQILDKVKKLLIDGETVQKIMQEYNKKNESKEEYAMNHEVRIKKLLSLVGLITEEDFKLYIDAVKMNSGGYSIILTRDIDEVFFNSYNPEWTLAWNENTDIQLCLNFFTVITYIRILYER